MFTELVLSQWRFYNPVLGSRDLSSSKQQTIKNYLCGHRAQSGMRVAQNN